jgi:hypothetical protein
MTRSEFRHFKTQAILVWSKYDDRHGYATGKIGRIVDLPNQEDSIITIFGMFDGDNQQKLLSMLIEPVANEVINLYKGN